jgi:hypothetical protein
MSVTLIVSLATAGLGLAGLAKGLTDYVRGPAALRRDPAMLEWASHRLWRRREPGAFFIDPMTSQARYGPRLVRRQARPG